MLDGILVADFSRVLAGPLAAMLLGDLGADVIKVERPDGGDDTRAWGPPWRDDVSTYYLALNRNKRSIALDLKDDGDLALARTLAERADVTDRVLPTRADGDVRPRRRDAARDEPGARHLLGDRVRLESRPRPGCPATTFCCRRWAA